MQLIRLILALMLVFTNTVSYAESTAEQNQFKSMIQQSIQNYYLDRKPSGGLLIAKDGEIIAAESFGYADRELRHKNNINTQFLIASVTKQFTAAAVLNVLYEKALATGINKNDIEALSSAVNKDLHAPLTQTMPLPAWAEQITLHHLLTHSSGIPNVTTTLKFKESAVDQSEIQKIMPVIAAMQLEFSPGSKFSYSNTNYFILSLLVQNLTGKTLDAYMQDKFFKPLNMQATSIPTGTVVDLKQRADAYKNLARGYEVMTTQRSAVIKEVQQYEQLHIVTGAGGMISTAADLLKWNNALYSGKVLPDFLLQLMLTPHIPGGTSSFDAYGYGIGVMNYPGLGTVYQHDGKIAGYKSSLLYIPAHNMTIVCYTNIITGGEEYNEAVTKVRADLPSDLKSKQRTQMIDAELAKLFPAYSNNEELYDTKGFVDFFMTSLSVNKQA